MILMRAPGWPVSPHPPPGQRGRWYDPHLNITQHKSMAYHVNTCRIALPRGPGGGYDEGRAGRAFREMLSAVEYMHARDVVHRDLKVGGTWCTVVTSR